MNDILQTLAHMDAPAAVAFVGLCASIALPVAVRAGRRHELERMRIRAASEVEIALVQVSVKNGAVPAIAGE